jgi:hypothetical protein
MKAGSPQVQILRRVRRAAEPDLPLLIIEE